MKNFETIDIMIRSIVSFIFTAQRDAAKAFEAELLEETKVILGAVPYDGLDGKQQRSLECLGDGLLADPSGKKHNVSSAMMQSKALARKLNHIFTQSKLTPRERTVVIRRYIDKLEDNQMISAIDGYTDVDELFQTAIAKISHVMEKEAEQSV